MVGLTRSLALEVARKGITVNAVAPGWIETASSTEPERVAGKNTPIGRAGTPSEVVTREKHFAFVVVIMLVESHLSCLFGRCLAAKSLANAFHERMLQLTFALRPRRARESFYDRQRDPWVYPDVSLHQLWTV